MKVRNGFVSNSSSSSFAIFGTTLQYKEFVGMMEAKGIEVGQEEDDQGNTYDDYPDYDSVYQALDEITKGTGLEYYLDEECNIALGRSFATLGDAETGAQFKADATAKVKAALGAKQVKCDTHIETWSTG